MLFSKFTRWTAGLAGTQWAFSVAVLVVAVWFTTGPIFGFSDTWQLVINTGTTIVTFLMVFLIQNTQNRDSAAMHLKLDELIGASSGAHLALLDLEELSQDDLDRIRRDYEGWPKKPGANFVEGNLTRDHQRCIPSGTWKRRVSATL